MTRSAIACLTVLLAGGVASAQSLDLPSHRWGLSFGNSTEFTGLRFNYRDHDVRYVRGINLTLWMPKEGQDEARVTGFSFGTVPGGGVVRGFQLGLLGVEANHELSGISVGLLGVGSGGSINGVQIGGLGLGSGGSVRGIGIGGLGIGSGEDLIGINVGGLGAGAGRNVWGLTVGGLGIGAGQDAFGVTVGGLGAGAGGNMTGFNVGGLGLGAGGRLTGINVAGLAVGAGERVAGINVAGLAVGAPNVRGISLAGAAVGGLDLAGVQLAVGSVYVPTGGRMTGFSASAVNCIKGTQTGVSIGIVNYAYKVRGLQIGVVNIVRDNPVYARVLPVLNAGF